MTTKLSDAVNCNPIIHLSEKDLPQLKKYDLGMTYTAIYRCKVIGKHIDDNGKVTGDLEIIGIKGLPYGDISEAVKGLKNG